MDKVNERYGLFFENHKPARCIIPTRGLHFDKDGTVSEVIIHDKYRKILYYERNRYHAFQ